MDKTLLIQKIAEWNKACEFFSSPEIIQQLDKDEKEAIEFLCRFWKENEYDKAACEKRIELLKHCDKLHSSNRNIIEKSKTLRGIAQTFYTKSPEDFNQFRTELGWKPTPTPKKETTPVPTPTPSPTPQHNEALMMINIEKWSKAMQFLRSENITPLLEQNELTAIELLDNMWRRPVYKPEMKEEAAEMVKVLVSSHKLHSSNREIIEHSKNLCGVARKVYENKEIFDAFKKAISQYYKDNQPKKRTPDPTHKPTPEKKRTPTPQRRDSEIIVSDVVFANTTFNQEILKDFGKTLYNDTQYITPRLIISSEFYGTEKIEITLKYSDGTTCNYDDNVTFNGKGKYDLVGWGSKSSTSFANYSYAEYTFKWRGKKIWQGRVTITPDPNKAQYPVISEIRFGATDYDGNVQVAVGSPIPTGIHYLKPYIVVSNNFRGSIKLDIKYEYEQRNTAKTDSEVYIQGAGEYELSGWGRSDGEFYTQPETIKVTISYNGKVLRTASVKIGKSSSHKKTPSTRSYNTSNQSLWQRFKDKIEDVGEWIEDKLDDTESLTGCVSLLIMIALAIVVISIWISEGFFSALAAAFIGFIVVGVLSLVIGYVARILLYILRFIFYNVWTFLIAVIILLANVIAPAAILAINGIIDSVATTTNTTEYINQETTTYYCTAERGVNVRIAPSTSASLVGSLAYNERVEVYEIKDDFARINYNGNEAWVSSKYIHIDNEDFFAENAKRKNIKSMDNGIQYEVIKKGKGDKPNADDVVKCHYESTLLNGTTIDSSRKGSEPIEFNLDNVIKGVSLSFQDMKEGERRRVYIPSHLAYGEYSNGIIPANSALIFDLELIEIVEEQEVAYSELLFTDFTVTQEDGTKVSLSDYVGKGRYALVHFWASWAAPCRKSFPHLVNFYRGHNKTLDMLGIAVWDKPEDSRAAIYNYDLEYPQIVNANETHTKLYNIDSVPHLILFDPDGRIIMQGSYSEDFLMEVKSIIYKN